MSLEKEIQDRLVTDTESILQDNLDRVEPMFQFHRDGTIDIHEQYQDTGPESQILIYLIAQRFAMEGSLADNDVLENDFFYKRIDRKERTVREYLQNLREEGMIEKEGRSSHRLIVENLPRATVHAERAAKETEGAA